MIEYKITKDIKIAELIEIGEKEELLKITGKKVEYLFIKFTLP